ncbi:MAG: hypothetical protein ACRDTG_31875 [Pseudonocardiaceae bacterium]
MQEQLEKRVAELEAEYRAGQEMLADLETKRADLQQTLLRISGAIQVLRELLGAESESVENGAESTEPSISPAHHDAAPAPSLLAG